jgi:hypothetical protein
MRGSDLEVARIAVWARSVVSGRVVVALAAVTLGVTQPAPAAEGVAPERRNWFDTPFGQAVDGLPDCPRPEGPLITESEMRSLGHARIERGTSCWLAKKCEDSNAYRRDPEIQARVLESIAAEPAFADASVWVTTERHWVTLQGCIPSERVRRQLLERVRRTAGVEEVFDQLIVGTTARPRWKVDAGWQPPDRKKKPTR